MYCSPRITSRTYPGRGGNGGNGGAPGKEGNIFFFQKNYVLHLKRAVLTEEGSCVPEIFRLILTFSFDLT